jgi:hypothetical protein
VTAALLERSAPVRAGSPRRAMVALARVEAVRYVRHPLTVAAVVLFLAPWIYDLITGSVDRFPVMTERVLNLQMLGGFVLGGAALVASNLAVLRAHRHHTDPLYNTLVLTAPWRAAAFLLAVLPYAVVAAVVFAVRVMVFWLQPGAAGRVHPADLAVVPVSVALLGAVGVLLGLLVRSPVVGPLALILYVAVTLTVIIIGAVRDIATDYVVPVAFNNALFPIPADLSERPSWRHLAYIALLAVLVAAVALRRAGAKVTVLVVAFAVCAAGTGAAQYWPDDATAARRAAVSADPAPVQRCRPVGDVTYCPFDDFASWVPAWDEVVRGVRRAVPAGAVAGPPLLVRQHVWTEAPSDNDDEVDAVVARWHRADTAAGFTEPVDIGTQWGSGLSEAAFAYAVAFRYVTGRSITMAGALCGARGALVVWLAGQATPATADGVGQIGSRDSDEAIFDDQSIQFFGTVPDRDAGPAFAALQRPVAEVTPIIAAHWAELADPRTSADRFAALLGVPIGPEVPVAERSVCKS